MPACVWAFGRLDRGHHVALGLYLALTMDKPIEPQHRQVFALVGVWCVAFDLLFLLALFTV